MPQSRPRLHFGFQTKVLVPVLALLVLLPALTLVIVTRHIGEQMEAEASRTLTTANGVFRQSLAIRQRSPRFTLPQRGQRTTLPRGGRTG
jgi:hypothetical protein